MLWAYGMLIFFVVFILWFGFNIILPWMDKRDGNEHLSRRKNNSYNENTSKKE
jgi:hypothetical protein